MIYTVLELLIFISYKIYYFRRDVNTYFLIQVVFLTIVCQLSKQIIHHERAEVSYKLIILSKICASNSDKVDADVAELLKTLMSQLLPLNGRSWVCALISDKPSVNW